jgi:hypothetical protein
LISMVHYLYRNSRHWAIAALLAISLFCGHAEAQIRDRTQHQQPDEQNQSKINAKPQKRGPRAIAVLEFLPGKGMRLVPVALWIDGHYNDASLYGANPEPMALQPDTMYEVLDTGERAGWFTVTAPHEDNGTWVADGRWKPKQALDEQIAERAAKQPKAKAPSMSNDDQGPPVLRRPGSSDSSSTSSKGGSSSPSSASGSQSAGTVNAPPPGNDDPDRPTLKVPKQQSSTTADTTDQNRNSDSSKAPASSQNVPSSAANDESDPNRPLLRRGKSPASSEDSKAQPAPAPKAAPTSVSAKAGPHGSVSQPLAEAQRLRSFPAISDAGDIETRSLLYAMPENERQNQMARMSGLAMEELRKFSSQHNLPPPAKTATLLAPDLRAFDLDYTNSPTLVLSAKLPFATPKARAGESTYFVTVVAREDVNGIPQKIFASTTTSNYLDAFPHMEIVDAVDADANGRGDLLFRQYSDTGINYSLYRVYPYQMVKIFEGGASM